MQRFLRAVLAVAFLACVARAENPSDITFTVRLTKDPPQYRSSEPIEFEISLSSSAEKKYHAFWTGLEPFGGIEIALEPKTGTVYLPSLQEGGFAYSILSSEGYLTATPLKETGDLTEWYRFDQPGHFRFSVAVDWVSRLKAKDEGGGKERIHVISNEIEFDVLPPDAALENNELASLLKQIDEPESEPAQQTALHQFDLMQTPAATQEKVERFLADGRRGYGFYYPLLLHVSDVDQAVGELQSVLASPSVDPPNGIIELLATLQVRQRLGIVAPEPASPDEKARWQEEWSKRNELHNQFVEQNTATLLKSITLRSGPEQLEAMFQAWSMLESKSQPPEVPSEVLVHLRSELLNASKELLPGEQSEFLETAWPKMPHGELLPVLQRIAMSNSYGSTSRDSAFKFWCEEWPADCIKPLLTAAFEKDANLGPETILLLPESEHAEFDVQLKTRITDPHFVPDYPIGSATAALISRIGSRNIKHAVEEYLDNKYPQQGRSCEVNGYLIAYLARIAPSQAATRLNGYLHDPGAGQCAPDVLRGIAHAETVQPVLPVILAALNSPELITAGAAALFLGQRAPDSLRLVLLKRLAGLRSQWRDQAADIASANMSDGMLWRVAQFEKELASSLAHATHWTLDSDERRALAEGCFTSECRQIAAGESWLGP